MRKIKAGEKIIFLFLFLFPLFACYGQSLSNSSQTSMSGQTNSFTNKSGFDLSLTVGGMVATVITAFFSVLGIIFVSLMVYAGYNWMTAAGEEEKVTKAKDTIRRAIIGLIITLSAYAITYFVFKNLPSGSGASLNDGILLFARGY